MSFGEEKCATFLEKWTKIASAVLENFKDFDKQKCEGSPKLIEN